MPQNHSKDEYAVTWYLMKSEGDTTFGPVTFEQLKNWAATAQISPLDKISDDKENWSKAPTFPGLEMDWLVESAPGQLYGPTTLGAVREFLEAGEINSESTMINCTDNSEHKLKDVHALNADAKMTGAGDGDQPARTAIRKTFQARMHELEEAVMEERKKRVAAEDKVRQLEARLAKLESTKEK